MIVNTLMLAFATKTKSLNIQPISYKALPFQFKPFTIVYHLLPMHLPFQIIPNWHSMPFTNFQIYIHNIFIVCYNSHLIYNLLTFHPNSFFNSLQDNPCLCLQFMIHSHLSKFQKIPSTFVANPLQSSRVPSIPNGRSFMALHNHLKLKFKPFQINI